MIFVGVDWAEAHHDICVLDEVGEVLPRQIGVADHDALGATGGARRVHQAMDVVGPSRDVAGPGRMRQDIGERRPAGHGRRRQAQTGQWGIDTLGGLVGELDESPVAHEGTS